MTALSQTIKTAIAIKDSPESIPTLATLQVLSLFGLTPQIISKDDLTESLKLPDESVLIVNENQLRTVLSKLRRQAYKGAVLILSAKPYKEILKQYSYLLQYAAKMNNAVWRSPYHLTDLLSQIQQLEPLSQGNFTLLQENFEKADQEVKNKIDKLENLINQLSSDNLDQTSQLEEIETQFETLFSPLSKHTKITLSSYGEATISTHFRQLLNEIRNPNQSIEQPVKLLHQIISILYQQIQDLGEDLSITHPTP